MSKGRRRLAALFLAPLLALAACERIEDAVERVREGVGVGRSPLEETPLEARATAGSVLPQDRAAALLAPQPVLAVGGQALLGARGEADVSRAAAAASDMLRRLGLEAEVKPAGGSLLIVRLEAASADPVEWNETDRCPILVTQRQLESDSALATRCAVHRLRASRRFAFVEPNYIAQPAQVGAGEVAPDDPLYPYQWPLRSHGASDGRSPGGAGFDAAWRTGLTDARDVRIAVLDTGLDLVHPDFAGSANVMAGVDVISDPARSGDGDGADLDVQDPGLSCGDVKDDEFHGARVAGVIGAAATGNRVGVAGAAWAVSLQPVRALGRCGGELADILAGLAWASGAAPVELAGGRSAANAAPADIVVLPFTIQAPCPAPLRAAIDAAAARNVLVVAAAGNRASRTELFAPANCANVVVAAAADARGELAFYSNFGPEVDVLAPGGDMFADADNDGRPDGVLTAVATQSGCYDPLTRNTAPRCFYAYAQGTSLAAAHVAAALALAAHGTGLRGRELEAAFFARAVRPLPAGFGQIECARSRNAIPLASGASLCARPAGRGALDLARFAGEP